MAKKNTSGNVEGFDENKTYKVTAKNGTEYSLKGRQATHLKAKGFTVEEIPDKK